MKQSVWKMVTVVLALMMMLAACSGNGANREPEKPAADNAVGNESSTSGNSANETAAEPAEEELEPVELIWYYPGPDVPADLQSVEDAVNAITQAKINATIQLMPVAFGDYNEKMNVVLASGEKADIIWTSSWLFDYRQNHSKGAFIELDALVDEYGAEVKASLPEFVFNAAKIDGKLYGIPNYQQVTYREGFVIQKRFADKYNLDINSIKQLEDIEPFLEQLKNGEPDVVPFLLDANGFYGGMQMALGYEWLANYISLDLNEPGKIQNSFDSPSYTRYLNFVRNLYTKGYINPDAATLKNKTDIIKGGNAAVLYHDGLNAGAEFAHQAQNGGQEVVLARLTPPYVQTASVIATMHAVSRTSEHPERAVMFINLLNTDKELYNTITYGVEGKHYTKISDNVIQVNRDAGYAPNTDWVFGNIFNGYLQEGQNPADFDQKKHDNETATPSPIMGFLFSPANVTAEVANITTVIDQYGPGLNTGTVSAEEGLAEFQSRLKDAGIDKVIEEAQKQLDAWKSAQ